jgi:hypothetical protein
VVKVRVWNKNRGNAPEGAVFIGRRSRHGNIYVIDLHGTRAQVIHLHKMSIACRPEYLDSLDELSGKDLLCFCVPKACHGDILLWLAARSREERRQWARDYLDANVNG